MSTSSLGKFLRGSEQPWWPHIRRMVILWSTQLVHCCPKAGVGYFASEVSIPSDLPDDPFMHTWVIRAIEIGIGGSQELTSVAIKRQSDTTVMISVVA